MKIKILFLTLIILILLSNMAYSMDVNEEWYPNSQEVVRVEVKNVEDGHLTISNNLGVLYSCTKPEIRNDALYFKVKIPNNIKEGTFIVDFEGSNSTHNISESTSIRIVEEKEFFLLSWIKDILHSLGINVFR